MNRSLVVSLLDIRPEKGRKKRGKPWFFESEGAATGTSHAHEIDVGVEPLTDGKEVAMRNIDNRVIRAEVSEGCGHENSMRGLEMIKGT